MAVFEGKRDSSHVLEGFGQSVNDEVLMSPPFDGFRLAQFGLEAERISIM